MYQVTAEINELTYRVIGACMEVHRELGPGFPEEYYQKALVIEFTVLKIDFEPQKPLVVEYKGSQVGLNYLDFLIVNQVVLEIKSVHALEDVHRAQVMKHLAAAGLDVALLVNFGRASLQHERILSPLKIQEHRKTRTTDLTD